MIAAEKILSYLISIYPQSATNSDIGHATGIQPHQQVFQVTRKLAESGNIKRYRSGREWNFVALSQTPQIALFPLRVNMPLSTQPSAMTPRRFENFARRTFSKHFNTPLVPGKAAEVDKEWDMLSADGNIIGDAKFYTLVGGKRKPPAKFSIIAEHVWLLEKAQADIKFLVFGNQIEVPRLWLGKYGNLVNDVSFYFLYDDGRIDLLHPSQP